MNLPAPRPEPASEEPSPSDEPAGSGHSVPMQSADQPELPDAEVLKGLAGIIAGFMSRAGAGTVREAFEKRFHNTKTARALLDALQKASQNEAMQPVSSVSLAHDHPVIARFFGSVEAAIKLKARQVVDTMGLQATRSWGSDDRFRTIRELAYAWAGAALFTDCLPNLARMVYHPDVESLTVGHEGASDEEIQELVNRVAAQFIHLPPS